MITYGPKARASHTLGVVLDLISPPMNFDDLTFGPDPKIFRQNSTSLDPLLSCRSSDVIKHYAKKKNLPYIALETWFIVVYDNGTPVR